MKRYSANSVKRELEKIAALTVHGGLACPQDTTWTLENNTQCNQMPEVCGYVNDQTCKQRLEIHLRKDGHKLIVLTFNFTVSLTNHDGFIDVNDQQMILLLNFAEKNAMCLSEKNFTLV